MLITYASYSIYILYFYVFFFFLLSSPPSPPFFSRRGAYSLVFPLWDGLYVIDAGGCTGGEGAAGRFGIGMGFRGSCLSLCAFFFFSIGIGKWCFFFVVFFFFLSGFRSCDDSFLVLCTPRCDGVGVDVGKW